MDSFKRTLVKTITWRIVALCSAFVVTYIITSDIKLSGTISVIQQLASTFWYWIHERVWANIHFGKND